MSIGHGRFVIFNAKIINRIQKLKSQLIRPTSLFIKRMLCYGNGETFATTTTDDETFVLFHEETSSLFHRTFKNTNQNFLLILRVIVYLPMSTITFVKKIHNILNLISRYW